MNTASLIPAPVKTDDDGAARAYYNWTYPRSEAYERAVRLPAGWRLYSALDADKDPGLCGKDFGATRDDGRAHVFGVRELDGSPKHLRATFPDRVRGRRELADKLFAPGDLAAACAWCDAQLTTLMAAAA